MSAHQDNGIYIAGARVQWWWALVCASVVGGLAVML